MKARWLPGFVALSAIWGSSFAHIKVTVDAGMPPLWVAFWRSLLGGIALCTLAATQGGMRTARAVWVRTAVAGFLLNAAPSALISYGETGLTSVQAAVWNATTPLFTLIFTLVALRGGERPVVQRAVGSASPTAQQAEDPAQPTAQRGAGSALSIARQAAGSVRPAARQAVGLGLGFLGVLTVLGVWQGPGSMRVLASGACLGGAACYGAGYAYSRRYLSDLPLPVSTLAAMQVSCAAIELAPVAPLTGLPRWPGLGAGGALLFLGVIGTGVAYALNLHLVRAAGPTITSTVTYVLPLWSTVLGGWLLAEPIGWNTPTGGLLVIAAIALTKATPRRSPTLRPHDTVQPAQPVQSVQRAQTAPSRSLVNFN